LKISQRRLKWVLQWLHWGYFRDDESQSSWLLLRHRLLQGCEWPNKEMKVRALNRYTTRQRLKIKSSISLLEHIAAAVTL
jgi:hypothetical protein